MICKVCKNEIDETEIYSDYFWCDHCKVTREIEIHENELKE